MKADQVQARPWHQRSQKSTDSWALAQLSVEHIQPAKDEYLDEVDSPPPTRS